jgi:hypothetical protein
MAKNYTPINCRYCEDEFTPRSPSQKVCDKPECRQSKWDDGRPGRYAAERRWEEKNPEKARLKHRKAEARYQKSHPEVRRRVEINYRKNHPERLREKERRRLEKDPAKAAERAALRRARRKNAPVVESVNRQIVAELAGWICKLCDEPIDPKASFRLPDGRNNPAYLNVEHYVPLSRNGEHSYANCYAAHALCNWQKQNKTPEEYKAWLDAQ